MVSGMMPTASPSPKEDKERPTKWPTCGPRAWVSVCDVHTYTFVWCAFVCALDYRLYCDVVSLCSVVGGESAVKLLSKFGLLEAAIDYATDNL